MADGRLLALPDDPAPPSPPAWFCELSAPQREVWAAFRQGRATAQDFFDTKPSDDARQAAQALDWPPEQILGAPSLPPDESGLSYRDLACYRMLKVPTPLSGRLLDVVWSDLFEHLSPGGPVLLQLTEEQTNRADALTQERVRNMRLFWERQSAARAFLKPLLQRLPAWSTNAAGAIWSQTPSDCALAQYLATTVNPNGDATGRQMTGKGWIISFVSERVLEAILARVMAENRFLIPDYAEATVSVANQVLSLPGFSSRPAESLRLAAATRTIGRPGAVTLDIAFYLTNREKMLSAEKRRARTFSALIAGAVLAALVGLVTARRAFYQQHRLSEMKSNFVSSVSHELRAPIASLRLLAEGLERGKISEAGKKQEYYRFLVQESRRLTSLIENVLDFSRIEQGRKEYQFELTDLDALVDQTVKLMHPAATDKSVELIVRPGAGLMLSCDALALQQALINLIDNAIKHSPAGAAVTIGQDRPAPHLLHLWVEDQGAGIPPAEHEKIFERFYRRGSELRRETQGIGIGLTIVKHIVEAHAGRVLVRSAAGQGSRFTLELPIQA